LTGASGFIGSALLPRLEREEYEVWQLLRYVSGGRYDYWERQRKVFADLRDHDAVREAVHEVAPEAIIHLGAITPVSFSFMSAVDVFEVNALGTINLANVAMDEGVDWFVHASTSECYGIQKEFPIREDANLNPTSPYAVAKIGAEHHLRLLREIHGFPVTIIRPFNTFGRANVRNRHYAVERAITMALEQHHIRLHNPKPVRDFLYRDDHVEAYVRCLENRRAVGETINVCTGRGVTIEEMARLVAGLVEERTGRKVEISWEAEPDRPLDIPVLIGSPERAKRVLGWRPRRSLEEGLRLAIEEWAKVLGC